MRLRTLLICLLIAVAPAASAQVNISINLSLFPELVQVPGYPVYYAPRQDQNYFFYDGLYWVFMDDQWYSSDWYNGPWYRVAPEYVPLYVLRIPVRYYRRPPPYFRGWHSSAPPRWGEHWGRDWEQRRAGWDRWNRGAVPTPAPLPTYQRRYTGDRYPRPDEQHTLNQRNYAYQPRDAMVRDHVRPQVQASSPQRREGGADQKGRDRDERRDRAQRPASAPERQNEPPRRDDNANRGRDARSREAAPAPVPAVRPAQPQAQIDAPRERQAPPRETQPRDQRPRQESAPPAKGAPPQPGPERQGRDNRGQDKGQDRGQEKGQDRSQDKGQDRGHDKGGDRNK
ncbi:MAG TPA: hypothetical protein VGO84_15925 [Burkholderiales bacterium]|nr:hypothetical protein [Burkholderiales bacterium]